jgi:hypothetical protein
MYMVCRLGGPERLADVYREFRTALAHGSSTDLQSAPSLPAFAYAAARRASIGEGAGSEHIGFGSIPWVPTPEDKAARYGETLDRLRGELKGETAEVLELHYARGLGVDDVAYVVGVSRSLAAQRIADGASQAHLTLSPPLTLSSETPFGPARSPVPRTRTAFTRGRLDWPRGLWSAAVSRSRLPRIPRLPPPSTSPATRTFQASP